MRMRWNIDEMDNPIQLYSVPACSLSVGCCPLAFLSLGNDAQQVPPEREAVVCVFRFIAPEGEALRSGCVTESFPLRTKMQQLMAKPEAVVLQHVYLKTKN